MEPSFKPPAPWLPSASSTVYLGASSKPANADFAFGVSTKESYSCNPKSTVTCCRFTQLGNQWSTDHLFTSGSSTSRGSSLFDSRSNWHICSHKDPESLHSCPSAVSKNSTPPMLLRKNKRGDWPYVDMRWAVDPSWFFVSASSPSKTMDHARPLSQL